MNTPHNKEIDLFDRKVLLSERTAADINRLIQFSKQTAEKDFTNLTIEYAVVVADALKINIKLLKWYQIFKLWRYKRILSKEYLLANLPPSLIFDIAKQVFELEGVTPEGDKKKAKPEAAESKSAETLQSA